MIVVGTHLDCVSDQNRVKELENKVKQKYRGSQYPKVERSYIIIHCLKMFTQSWRWISVKVFSNYVYLSFSLALIAILFPCLSSVFLSPCLSSVYLFPCWSSPIFLVPLSVFLRLHIGCPCDVHLLLQEVVGKQDGGSA